MPKSWKLKPVDLQAVQEIQTVTGLPFAVARALASRQGEMTMPELKGFLDARLGDLSDPFLLPDMEKAARRIRQAVAADETLVVFGDYDVDGVTSAALLTRILNALGAKVSPFIPDRLDEGYGLSSDALDRCIELHSPSLIITVDCGVNSVESVKLAQMRGVDVIVTDHHEPEKNTAPAFALVNPKLGKYPELAMMSGVGVAFKTAHALLKQGRDAGDPACAEIDLRDYLDIAALGTVADLVPLVGENRVLVRHGLSGLNKTRWEGMKALKRVAGIRDTVSTYNLGFQLGPRINAAGRIGKPMQALQLLITDDAAEAREIADLLDQTNLERRKLEQDMADQAFAEIDAFFDPEQNYGLIIAGKGWHPGVVGIVASRVARHYNRPAIVLGIDDEGLARGSCRSIEAYDLLVGLESCSTLLSSFGGHKMAAGVVLAADQVEAFKVQFNKAAKSALESSDLSPIQELDAEVQAEELDWSFYNALQRLEPFGQENPEPVWILSNTRVVGTPRVVGKKHLKLTVESHQCRFDAIAFNFAEADFPAGPVDLAFTLKENHWNGNRTLQLQLRDVRAAEPA